MVFPSCSFLHESKKKKVCVYNVFLIHIQLLFYYYLLETTHSHYINLRDPLATFYSDLALIPGFCAMQGFLRFSVMAG